LGELQKQANSINSISSIKSIASKKPKQGLFGKLSENLASLPTAQTTRNKSSAFGEDEDGGVLLNDATVGDKYLISTFFFSKFNFAGSSSTFEGFGTASSN
jgi:hypothetical protein